MDIICHFTRKLQFVTPKFRCYLKLLVLAIRTPPEKEEYSESDGEESSDGSNEELRL